MSRDQNLQIMQKALDAFRAGDMTAMSQVFAQDVVWRVPGKSVLSKEYKGQAEFFGLLGQLMELTGGTFKVDTVDMFANEDGGIFVDRLTAERGGRRLDIGLVLHAKIRNGQIVEGTDHFHQEHLWDAFWA